MFAVCATIPPPAEPGVNGRSILHVAVKRRLTKFVVLILLGAIVNVAVAWGCSLWSGSGSSTPIATNAVDKIWHRHLSFGGDVAGFAVSGSKSFGYTVLWAESRSWETTQVDLIHLSQAGWPARCLVAEAGSTAGRNKESEYTRGWNAPTGIGPIPVGDGNPRVIPFHPIWGGFALNTILFATAIWFLTRRYVLGWATPRERNQYIAFGDVKWLGRRGATSLLVGLLLTMVMVFIYCLVPHRCLQGRSSSVGATHLGDNVIWEVYHRDGTGVTLIQSYVYDHEEVFGEEMPQAGILAGSAESVTPIWGQRALRRVRADDSSNWFVLGYGWPATALWSASRFTGQAYADLSGVVQHDKRFGGLLLRPATGRNLPISIPLRPDWPGIVIDVSVNSSLVFLLLMCFALTRRQIRRAGGLCIKCGYDLSGSSGGGCVCPECGAGRR